MSRMVLRIKANTSGNPMGMDKSGNQTISSSQTNQQITGWINRAGFPSTVITSDQLRPDGSMSVTVNAALTLTSNWFSGTPLSIDIMKNSTVLTTTSIAFATGSGTATPTSTTVTSTDTLWMRYTSAFGASGTIASGTGTYLYYTVP